MTRAPARGLLALLALALAACGDVEPSLAGEWSLDRAATWDAMDAEARRRTPRERLSDLEMRVSLAPDGTYVAAVSLGAARHETSGTWRAEGVGVAIVETSAGGRPHAAPRVVRLGRRGAALLYEAPEAEVPSLVLSRR